MKRQNHFNLKRFNKALQHDVVLNTKTYLFFVLGLFFALIFFDFFALANTGSEFPVNEYSTLFFFSFVISTIVVVGTSFPWLRNKKSTANYLMLPASVFEKFLIQFLIRILCFFILFMFLFWIDFKITKAIYNMFEWSRPTEIGTFGLFDPFMSKGFKNNLDITAGACWLVTIATFVFAGATYFKKYALFKTILSFVLIVLVFAGISSVFTYFFFPERFTSRNGFIDLASYEISENLINTQFFFYVTGMGSSLFLLPLAYFKLKEREL